MSDIVLVTDISSAGSPSLWYRVIRLKRYSVSAYLGMSQLHPVVCPYYRIETIDYDADCRWPYDTKIVLIMIKDH